MKKKKINSFDIIIEKLSGNFSKINNFHLLQESDEGKKLFDLIVKQISELEGFQTLFLNYYIPASNRAAADGWNQISNSKYKHLLGISKSDLKENIYETIRLGYVGLFHKYESYLKALVEAANFLLKDLNEEGNLLSIEKYCKKEFGVDIFKSHHKFSITKRVNYISNCIKHYDGLPIKEPIHEDFIEANRNKRIEIKTHQFKHDIKMMKIHCELLLSQVLTIGFKQFIDQEYEVVSKSFNPELKKDQDLREKYEEIKDRFNTMFSDFLK